MTSEAPAPVVHRLRIIAPTGVEMGGRLLLPAKGDPPKKSTELRVGFPSPPGARFSLKGIGLSLSSGFRIHDDDLGPAVAAAAAAGLLARPRPWALFEKDAADKLTHRYVIRWLPEPLAEDVPEAPVLLLTMNPKSEWETGLMKRVRELATKMKWPCVEVASLFSLIGKTKLVSGKDGYNVEPVGPLADDHLKDAISRASLVICAWGGGINVSNRAANAKVRGRGAAVVKMITDLGKTPMSFGVTKNRPIRVKQALAEPYRELKPYVEHVWDLTPKPPRTRKVKAPE